MLLGAWLFAQTGAEFKDALAFVDVKVEVGDGTRLERATVLVRDGRIERVGTDVPVPEWYRRIDGKGKTLSPAAIDAYYALPAPPVQENPDVDGGRDQTEDAAYTMRIGNRRGVRAELDAATLPAPAPELLLAERKAGFGLLNLVPAGQLVGGSAALVEATSLPRREAVVARETGRAFGFRFTAPAGAPRAYPASLLGNIAHLRQFLSDAQSPVTPGDDPALVAVRRKSRAFWQSDSEVEIRRAARLGAEFGWTVVPVGASELDLATDVAKGPVVLSPNPVRFPIPPAGSRAIAERDALRDERRKALATALKDRPFALTRSGYGDRSEFFADLKRLVAAGLPREKAIRAMFLGGAEVTGTADRVGTVAPGKLAYLALWDDDPLSGKPVDALVLGGRYVRPADERAPASSPRIPTEEDLCGCGGNAVHLHDLDLHHPGGSR